MAFTQTSIVSGVATFLFYGLLPTALLMWLGGTRTRRKKRAAAERKEDGAP